MEVGRDWKKSCEPEQQPEGTEARTRGDLGMPPGTEDKKVQCGLAGPKMTFWSHRKQVLSLRGPAVRPARG